MIQNANQSIFLLVVRRREPQWMIRANGWIWRKPFRRRTGVVVCMLNSEATDPAIKIGIVKAITGIPAFLLSPIHWLASLPYKSFPRVVPPKNKKNNTHSPQIAETTRAKDFIVQSDNQLERERFVTSRPRRKRIRGILTWLGLFPVHMQLNSRRISYQDWSLQLLPL